MMIRNSAPEEVEAMTQTILVVDDDRHIREVVRYALSDAGFQVLEAEHGAAALDIFNRGGVDLIVLDIIMPEDDGLAVCRKIRSQSTSPIIFLSSRDDELDRILGLELGADDYLTKPFSPRELVARIRAVFRRIGETPATNPTPDDDVIQHGPLSMDPQRYRCTWTDQEIVLTVTEFALLRAMLQTPGRVFNRDELVDRAYGHGHVITDRTVDSHIRRIRKKLSSAGGDPVETVYGVGYRVREVL
ncbi:MAG: response regulator transcription factor [Myxococcota bacterium]